MKTDGARGCQYSARVESDGQGWPRASRKEHGQRRSATVFGCPHEFSLFACGTAAVVSHAQHHRRQILRGELWRQAVKW